MRPTPTRLATRSTRTTPIATPFTVSPASPVVLSDPVTCDLRAYRGDTGRFQVSLTDSGGAPIVITGATWDCDVRATRDDTTTVGSLTVTPIDTNTVEITLTKTLSETLPAAAVWDLQMTLAGEVKTLLSGALLTSPDVSRV